MKLVSAAKLRRAQDAATNGRDYRDRLQGVLETVSVDLAGNFDSPLLKQREVKKRRVIVIAGERGLCGAYNSNVIKRVNADAKDSEVELEYVAIGRRAVSAANRYLWNTVEKHESLPEDANLWPIDKIISKSIADFESGACDEVIVYYTTFVSALTQQVTKETLLPLTNVSASDEVKESPAPRDFAGHVQYDPGAREIAESVLPLLTRTRLLQASFESKASEHAARMTAMDAATNNADDLIHSLKLYYNRARQSAITTELLDILGGAEALQG